MSINGVNDDLPPSSSDDWTLITRDESAPQPNSLLKNFLYSTSDKKLLNQPKNPNSGSSNIEHEFVHSRNESHSSCSSNDDIELVENWSVKENEVNNGVNNQELEKIKQEKPRISDWIKFSSIAQSPLTFLHNNKSLPEFSNNQGQQQPSTSFSLKCNYQKLQLPDDVKLDPKKVDQKNDYGQIDKEKSNLSNGLSSIHSCLDELNDAAINLDLNPTTRIRTYVHRRNERLDSMLTSLLPFIFTAALSLGIGSYLGSYHASHYNDRFLLTSRELRLMSLLQNKIITCLRDQIIMDNGIYRTVCTRNLNEITRDFEQTFKLSPELKYKLQYLHSFDTTSNPMNVGNRDIDTQLRAKLCNINQISQLNTQDNNDDCDLYDLTKHNFKQLVTLHSRWHILLDQLRFVHIYKLYRTSPILSLNKKQDDFNNMINVTDDMNFERDLSSIHLDEYLNYGLTKSDLVKLVDGLMLENKLLWLSDPESSSKCTNGDSETNPICGIRDDLSIKSEMYYMENKFLWKTLEILAGNLDLKHVLQDTNHNSNHNRGDLSNIKERILKLEKSLLRQIYILKRLSSIHYQNSKSTLSNPVIDDLVTSDIQGLRQSEFEKKSNYDERGCCEALSGGKKNVFNLVSDYSWRGLVTFGHIAKTVRGQINDLGSRVGEHLTDFGARIGEHVKKTTGKAKKKLESDKIKSYFTEKCSNFQNSLFKNFETVRKESATKVANKFNENFLNALSSTSEFFSKLGQKLMPEPTREEKNEEETKTPLDWLKSMPLKIF